jgi:hypothetical protein
MNTSHSINQPAFPTIPSASGMPKLTYENIVDPSSLDGGDSDSEDGYVMYSFYQIPLIFF